MLLHNIGLFENQKAQVQTLYLYKRLKKSKDTRTKDYHNPASLMLIPITSFRFYLLLCSPRLGESDLLPVVLIDISPIEGSDPSNPLTTALFSMATFSMMAVGLLGFSFFTPALSFPHPISPPWLFYESVRAH